MADNSRSKDDVPQPEIVVYFADVAINTIVICNMFPVPVDTSSDNEKEVSQLTPAVTMRRKCHS